MDLKYIEICSSIDTINISKLSFYQNIIKELLPLHVTLMLVSMGNPEWSSIAAIRHSDSHPVGQTLRSPLQESWYPHTEFDPADGPS